MTEQAPVYTVSRIDDSNYSLREENLHHLLGEYHSHLQYRHDIGEIAQATVEIKYHNARYFVEWLEKVGLQ